MADGLELAQDEINAGGLARGIPVRLVAYCGRSLDGSAPRYKFPAGFAKSQVLFNLHRAAASGEPPASWWKAFWIAWAALYDHQRCLLTDHFRRIILMLDGDSAGRRASGGVAAQLKRWCPVRVIELPSNTQPVQTILAEKGGQPKSYCSINKLNRRWPHGMMRRK